jgi:hypothetical protein
MEKLILLKRNRPVEYEIHRGEINQTHNLILTTQDKQFAEDLIEGYNNIQYLKNIGEKMTSIIDTMDKTIKQIVKIEKKNTKKNGKKRTNKRIPKH